MSIRDWPVMERPREKLLELGPGALSEAELLAIVIRTGRRGASAVDLARTVLKEFRSLRGLLSADAEQFCRHAGLGMTRYAQLQAALELARRHYQEALQTGPGINSPRATREFLIARLRDRPYEVFCCLHLDNRHRLIAFDELFRGTIDGASVHPREVVKQALARNAAAVILAHNHPKRHNRMIFKVDSKTWCTGYPPKYPRLRSLPPGAMPEIRSNAHVWGADLSHRQAYRRDMKRRTRPDPIDALIEGHLELRAAEKAAIQARAKSADPRPAAGLSKRPASRSVKTRKTKIP